MDKDPFDDIASLRIDPAGPVYAAEPKPTPKPKKKWQRQFVKVPWSWIDRLKASDRGSTYRLALCILYEHWQAGGRAIRLTNAGLRREGVTRWGKWRGLRELEQVGLIRVEGRPGKTPRITLLVDPRGE